MKSYVFEVVPADLSHSEPVRLDLFLSRKTLETRAFVQLQIERARVKLNGTVVLKCATKVKSGDRVDADFAEQTPSTLLPVPGDLDILFEDDSFLAINKAQGVVVHPATGHRGPTLVHYLLHHLSRSDLFQAPTTQRPGIVHRLDRGTTGVILVAKTRAAQEELSRQFKSREIKKEYEAVAWGKMQLGGRFESVIGRDRVDRKKMSSRTTAGRDSLTLWKRESAFQHFSHVALLPHTGRTHQLRVHLSEAGHPILGDSLYGKGATPKRIKALNPELQSTVESVTMTFLHARALHLTHPKNATPMTLRAPRPPEFERLLEELKKWDS